LELFLRQEVNRKKFTRARLNFNGKSLVFFDLLKIKLQREFSVTYNFYLTFIKEEKIFV